MAFWGGAEVKRKALGTIILTGHASLVFSWVALAGGGTLVERLGEIHG
jgi:hypothetical protein